MSVAGGAFSLSLASLASLSDKYDKRRATFELFILLEGGYAGALTGVQLVITGGGLSPPRMGIGN